MKDRLRNIYNELKNSKKIKTQAQFAEKLGYRDTYVSALMNGKEDISDKIITRLEEVFMINQNFIRKGEGRMFIETPEQKKLRIENERMAQGLKIATGNTSIRVEDLGNLNNNENNNKGSNISDAQHTTDKESSLNLFPLDKNGDNLMKEILQLLKEEQRQRALLIESNNLLAKEITGHSDRTTLKNRRVS